MKTTWHGIDVVVLGAMVWGAPAAEWPFAIHPDYVDVRVSFSVDGTFGEDEPPRGATSEVTVRMSEIDGPVEYATAGGLMVTLRS